MRTDQELKQLAMDIFENKVFTDRHIDYKNEIKMVFMPLGLGAFSDMKEEDIKEISMIYEYYDKAGPTSINGYPTFFSLNYLTNREFEIMMNYFDKYKKLKREFENE